MKLCDENSNRVFAIVAELQPVTAQRVREELQRRHGMQVEPAEVVHYMEWLRSGFPRKLAHAGPERWTVVDLV